MLDSVYRFYKKITPLWLMIIAFIVSVFMTWFIVDGDFGIVVPQSLKEASFYTFAMASTKNQVIINLLCIFFSRGIFIVFFALAGALDSDEDYIEKRTYQNGRTEYHNVTAESSFIMLIIIIFGAVFLPIIPCLIALGWEIIKRIINWHDERAYRNTYKKRRY